MAMSSSLAILHSRHCSLSKGRLLIVDQLLGNFSLATHFILHPSIKIQSVDQHHWQLIKTGLKKSIYLKILKGAGHIGVATYAPEFGKQTNTSSIEVDFNKSSEICVEILWNADEKS